MKQKTNGIERLYRLIGDNKYDYYYGLFTTEESPDCHFRVSVNDKSFLYRLGIAPDLVICVSSKKDDLQITDSNYQSEKTYIFPGMQDYDDTKKSWFFPINDKEMLSIAKAECVKSICIQTPIECLDLYRDESNVWRQFFLAAVAECEEGISNSRELEEFCIQRRLAAVRYSLKRHINASEEAWDRLFDLATSNDGNIII